MVCSRIAQACSWASPDIEVIIRDNSGDLHKREFLGHLRRDHCNIVLAEPCDGLVNFSEILRMARGEFIFMLADDDLCFERAIAALPDVLGGIEDPSVAGVTAAYVVETAQGSSLVSYQNLESHDVVERVVGYLRFGGPNILHYAPIRRDIVQRVFALMNDLPCYFSFHDQITCLLYVLNGKFARLQRLLYLYDMGDWETADSAQKKDVAFYAAAGLDPAINRLHWLLCGFEGAALAMHADVFPNYPAAQRQAIADRWFGTMFLRFKSVPRQTFDSPFAAEAEKLFEKVQGSVGQLSFEGVLAEISGFIALLSKTRGQSYFDFWGAMIHKRKPALRRPARETG